MPPSLLLHLESWANRAPTSAAVQEDGTTLSIETLLASSRVLASALRAAGVRAGDRVAWWGHSSSTYARVLVATWQLDATYVGIHPRYTVREVSALVDRVEPRIILHEDSAPAVVGADDDAPPRWLALCRAVSAVLSQSSADTLPSARGEHPALIVFTTGSTGTPKAAVISHRAVAAASANQAASMTVPARYTINALPANHIGGLVNITTAAWWEASCVVCVPVFSSGALIHVLRRLHDVRLGAVPMLFRRCLDDEAFADGARGRLVHALSGGAPMLRSVYDGLTALGVRVQGMYGQTEMAGSVCFTASDDDPATCCESIGRPHARIQARLAAIDSVAAEHEEGELQVCGAQVFDGYFRDPDATREVFTDDGWLRSGDLARRRADGTLELTGRLKDVINTRGYKVMPREVEEILLLHPRVVTAAVLGAPDATSGEAVVAFMTTRDGAALGIDDVVQWCAPRLAHYKIPRRAIVLPALPLMGVGKIDRQRLRTELGQGLHG
jgi:acyl-CoA synthetase (AMP-forming)/AMP-acid ligase II